MLLDIQALGKFKKIFFLLFAQPKVQPQASTLKTKKADIRFQLLIKGCLRGERTAQNELYRQLAPALFTVCLRYAPDRVRAGEILQEGFIKLFSSLEQYRNEGSFEGWAKRIMVTTALQHFRRQSPLRAVKPIDDEQDCQIQSHEETVEARMSAKELLLLVQSLPSACRTVFNLYVFEGFRHREIAEMLNISEGTSKSNLYDARQLLKEKLLLVSIASSKTNCP